MWCSRATRSCAPRCSAGRWTDGAQSRRREAAPQGFRILVQAGATRSRFGQDVPTLKELGCAVEMASERGVVAPAGIPPAILARSARRRRRSPATRNSSRQLEDRFTEPAYEPGEDWFARLRRQEADYRTLWQRTPWVQKG